MQEPHLFTFCACFPISAIKSSFGIRLRAVVAVVAQTMYCCGTVKIKMLCLCYAIPCFCVSQNHLLFFLAMFFISHYFPENATHNELDFSSLSPTEKIFFEFTIFANVTSVG